MSVRRIMLPSISYIVARSFPDNIIGCENQLPWHLKSDLQNFKRLTNNKAVIMGRKTFDSIGRPLPNRKNIVLTRNVSGLPDEVEAVSNIESALFLADLYSILNEQKEFFVIGGDQIYKIFQEFCNKIYLTEVFVQDIDGDAFFNIEYDRRQWKTVSENEFAESEFDDHPFRITELERRMKFTRILEIDKFYTDLKEKTDYLNRVNIEEIEKKIERVEILQEEMYFCKEYA